MMELNKFYTDVFLAYQRLRDSKAVAKLYDLTPEQEMELVEEFEDFNKFVEDKEDEK